MKSLARSLLALLIPFVSSASTGENVDRLATKYLMVKNKLVEGDVSQRKVLSSLFNINTRIRKISEKHQELTNKAMFVNGNVRDLARQIAELEATLKSHRLGLVRNLRGIYMMSGQGLLRVLFTSENAHDFDRNLKFLKILSERDYKMVRHYQAMLKLLEERRLKLQSEVRKLAQLQKSALEQERELEQEQNSKSKILTQLREQRRDYLRKIKNIRHQAQSLKGEDLDPDLNELLQGAFFEKKGQLIPPVVGQLSQDFGLWIDPVYRYRLNHKGHYYTSKIGSVVRGVHSGKVAFVGNLTGYGRAVIVDHGDHYYTVYAPAERVKVRLGEHIDSGQVIASVGWSKQFEAPGLYFEIRHFSDAIDPKNWLKPVAELEGQQL